MTKKIFLLLLAALIAGGAQAYDFCATAPTGQMLYYNNNDDGTVTLTYPGEIGNPYTPSHPGPEGVLVIPSQVEGKTVSAIGSLALYGCPRLTSVTVPETVTQIGGYAFAYNTSLEELVLPATLTKLPNHICSHCTSLPSITIPAAATIIGEVAFGDCESLTAIILPDATTIVEDNAFDGCTSLASIDLNRVEKVGYSVFNGCTSLTSITLPESLDTIGSSFYGCTGLRQVVLNAPNCIMGNGQGAFPINDYITDVVIGPAVVSIPDKAFYGFSALEEVVIPDNVQTIGEDGLSYAYGLRSLTIGSGVCSIGDYAFAGNRELDSIVMRGPVPTIASATFSLVPDDIPLHVPCGQGAAYAAAEYWSRFTNIIEDCGEASIDQLAQPQIQATVEGRQITIRTGHPVQVRLSDVVGRTLYEGTVQTSVRIAAPASGLYVMQTSDGTSTKVLVR